MSKIVLFLFFISLAGVAHARALPEESLGKVTEDIIKTFCPNAVSKTACVKDFENLRLKIITMEIKLISAKLQIAMRRLVDLTSLDEDLQRDLREIDFSFKFLLQKHAKK